MIARLGCVLAAAGLSSGVLAGDALTGDRSVRSPTICPSGIFIDPATLPRNFEIVGLGAGVTLVMTKLVV